MKKILLVVIFLVIIILGIKNVNAEFISVSTAEELKSYFNTGGECKLESDITFTANTGVNQNTTIDLNGHIINLTNKTLVPYATLTIMDSSSTQEGKITSSASFVIQIGSSSKTGAVVLNSGTIEGTGAYGVRNFGNLTINGGLVTGDAFVIYNQGNFTMNGGTVLALTGIGVRLNADSKLILNNGLIRTNGDSTAVVLGNPGASFVMNDGKIEAPYENLPKGGMGVMAYKDTDVTINGGIITSSSHALGSNGSVDGSSAGTNAKFTVNGGVITSKYGMGMYIPQPNGDNTINGGVITGASAVEIRAGSLKITGGTLNSNSDVYESASNTNGSTTNGASVSVVQHTTKLPIDIHICGATFNGVVPFSQTNPELNSVEDINKISINIDRSCGTPVFNSTSGNVTVYSENLTGFIRGGKYTHDVMNYVATGYGEKTEDNMNAIYKYHNVTINDTINGQSVVSKQRALYGDEITIEHNPEDDSTNFVFEIVDASGHKITAQDNKFILPDDDVSVRVQYVKEMITAIDPAKKTNKIITGPVNKELTKKIMLDALKNDAILYTAVSNMDPIMELVVREMELTADSRNQMLSTIKSSDGIILKSFDIYIEVKDNAGNVIGTIRDIPEELLLAVVMPDDVSTVKSGYKRKYIVVEDNEGYQVLEPDVDANTILFKTKKLSSYTVVYTEKKLDSDVLGDTVVVNSPNTNDSIKHYVLLFMLSLIIINVLLIKKFLFSK